MKMITSVIDQNLKIDNYVAVDCGVFFEFAWPMIAATTLPIYYILLIVSYHRYKVMVKFSGMADAVRVTSKIPVLQYNRSLFDGLYEVYKLHNRSIQNWPSLKKTKPSIQAAPISCKPQRQRHAKSLAATLVEQPVCRLVLAVLALGLLRPLMNGATQGFYLWCRKFKTNETPMDGTCKLCH